MKYDHSVSEDGSVNVNYELCITADNEGNEVSPGISSIEIRSISTK
jgi:hypothetical protein